MWYGQGSHVAIRHERKTRRGGASIHLIDAAPFSSLNRYSEHIPPGTDFVASRAKQFEVYREELEVPSDILKHVTDTTLRNIALGQSYFKVLGMNYQARSFVGIKQKCLIKKPLDFSSGFFTNAKAELLCLSHFVVRHDFQCTYQCAVVPCLTAMGRAGVEQLLRGSGIGQGQADCLGSLQG